MKPPTLLPLLRARAQAVGSYQVARRYATSQQPSATSHFYKTFSRPIAKTLLLAVFTYQVIYWGWAKLEAKETRAETDAAIAKLQATVDVYQEAKKQEAVRALEAKK
ncbi:hypothetical protein CDD82_6872 [Ophiocordyceps australis]|uniref:Uncharacterized protein n=1 Tax=Ophiocordyceps australis TaxID=1399860 RepID=A0A2C5YVE3_9HYPO|nr:hypothetical protein CDD82_6872 [Ophiocordyceps australis]